VQGGQELPCEYKFTGFDYVEKTAHELLSDEMMGLTNFYTVGKLQNKIMSIALIVTYVGQVTSY